MSKHREADIQECRIESRPGQRPICALHKCELLTFQADEVGFVYPNPHNQDVAKWICPESKKPLFGLEPIKGF